MLEGKKLWFLEKFIKKNKIDGQRIMVVHITNINLLSNLWTIYNFLTKFERNNEYQKLVGYISFKSAKWIK